MPRRAKTKGPQPADVHVGSRMRLRRNMLGVSQMEMAQQIGVSFQQVQKYEKGVNRIGASRLLRICAVLEVAPAWLFEDAPGAKRRSTAAARRVDDAIAAFHADHLAPQLMLAWRRLTVRVRRSMVTLMTVLAEESTKAGERRPAGARPGSGKALVPTFLRR